MDPVGVRPLDALSVDPYRMPWHADDGRVLWHIDDDDAVGADLGAVSDGDRAEQLGAGADSHVVLDGGVTLTGREAGAAQRDALIERYVIADDGGFADHDPGSVVDEKAVADAGRGMDLDSGHGARCKRDRARQRRHARLIERVSDAMCEERLDAGPGRQQLWRADAAGRRIALAGRRDVAANFAHHALENVALGHSLERSAARGRLGEELTSVRARRTAS